MIDIEKTVREIWLIYTNEDPYHHSKRTLRHYKFDSLDRLELAMDLEDAFGIDIDDSMQESMATMTFSQLVDFVRISKKP